ncbi:MAG: NOB1 family endonuclease [Thermoplasmatota archaeon]
MELVLDTSLLLGGKEPPRGTWSTTPEAAAEVSPGGRDARRFQDWLSLGLEVRSAGPKATDRVDDAAMQAGNLGRLSEADRSLLALAFERKAILVTDDFTMLDLAMRLGIQTQTVNQDGPVGTVDWQPRCIGCGKRYETMPRGDECVICGSPVRLKRA